MNKSVNINGVKTKVNFEYNQEAISTEYLGKKVRYKYFSGKEKIVTTVNSLVKDSVIFTINGTDYSVYAVTTNKVNRGGWLVTGYKYEYNGVRFTSEKKVIEYILS